MYDLLNKILHSLMAKSLSELNPENIAKVSAEAVRIIQKDQLDERDVANASMIISISQIVYNNTDKDNLFLDDGVYDILLEKYKNYNANFQVGAPVIDFLQSGEAISNSGIIRPMTFIDESFDKGNSLFYKDLSKMPPLDSRMFTEIDRNSGRKISKKNINVPHMYPKLVGSLDKCKFTLDSEAMEMGVYDDENVKIFERDFLAKHLRMGLIDMYTPFELVAELKYDGISVEADVTNKILSARSRGDANADIAADLSPILKDYVFPYAPEIPEDEAFGMKFEAIITHNNLDYMSKLRGKSYKNSRNGIIGLFGSSDAYDYRDLITLVPLATSIEGIDRVTEIEFLNKYYHSGEYLRYSILRGTYSQLLYQVKKFVDEAEAIRSIMPFMYDGVVISYRDPKIINILGRENSINKYSMAIKFNPLVRDAIFTGYSYTVGQDGTITPMIHYTPVEFYGTIHDKSSGHSYNRFHELALAPGDVIQVKYTNDVMPYVTKPAISTNLNNPNLPIEFPKICPFCGAPIVVSESFKSAACPNMNCPERVVAKMTNMMDKMNIKDFGEETFRKLKTRNLAELLSYPEKYLTDIFGQVQGKKLYSRIEYIKNTTIFDYKIIGSIGFTGIAIETWRKILNVIPLQNIITAKPDHLFLLLSNIRSIGPRTAQTIIDERSYLMDDLILISKMENVISSYGIKQGLTVRYTGCRPEPELTDYLTNKGCDARPNAGVTKNTDILVVPYLGFTSSKVSKVGPTTRIIDIGSFTSYPDKYIM